MARLPSSSSGDGVPPGDVYKMAVEEYRFQAHFNWSRTQYLLAFNAGILATAAGLSSLAGNGALYVFVLGFIAAILSIPAVRVMHDYYTAARDRMQRVEEEVSIPMRQRFDTTSTLGHRKRRVSVNQIVFLLLGSLAAANLVGFVVVLTR